MGSVSDLLAPIKLPKMILVKQKFAREQINKEDIERIVFEQMNREAVASAFKPGMRIGITAGSRGITNIKEIVKAAVDWVKSVGCEPFVFPAMGSHGGATAEGQLAVLKGYGITEEYLGCPIISSMEVVSLGTTELGVDAFYSKTALEADGVILCGRIKPHTAFRGTYESGFLKMAVIGCGKQHGADIVHHNGPLNMGKTVECVGKYIINHSNVIAGLGIIENSFDQTYKLIGLNPQEIIEQEPALLIEARSLMGKIRFENADVLVVDYIGKNFSGDGMDPNITGRYVGPNLTGGLAPKRLAVLALAPESHHNGNGVGMADATTERFEKEMIRDLSYPNVITSTGLVGCALPVVVANDKEAIQICVHACTGNDPENPRVVRIPNTRDLEYIWISEAMIPDAEANPEVEIVGELQEFNFDANGNLF